MKRYETKRNGTKRNDIMRMLKIEFWSIVALRLNVPHINVYARKMITIILSAILVLFKSICFFCCCYLVQLVIVRTYAVILCDVVKLFYCTQQQHTFLHTHHLKDSYTVYACKRLNIHTKNCDRSITAAAAGVCQTIWDCIAFKLVHWIQRTHYTGITYSLFVYHSCVRIKLSFLTLCECEHSSARWKICQSSQNYTAARIEHHRWHNSVKEHHVHRVVNPM